MKLGAALRAALRFLAGRTLQHHYPHVHTLCRPLLHACARDAAGISAVPHWVPHAALLGSSPVTLGTAAGTSLTVVGFACAGQQPACVESQHRPL